MKELDKEVDEDFQEILKTQSLPDQFVKAMVIFRNSAKELATELNNLLKQIEDEKNNK